MYKLLVMNYRTVHSCKTLGKWGVHNHYSWGCMVKNTSVEMGGGGG